MTASKRRKRPPQAETLPFEPEATEDSADHAADSTTVAVSETASDPGTDAAAPMINENDRHHLEAAAAAPPGGDAGADEDPGDNNNTNDEDRATTTTITPPDKIWALISADRIVGLIVAAAVGDALGWPQEDRSQIVGGDEAREVAPRPQYRDWERNAGTQYGRYLDPVGAGEYSDDTQLMLAVARACQRDDWFYWLSNVELPFWPVYQRGGGGAVLSASRAWADGHPPWAPTGKNDDKVSRYFDAGANGVAMRIAPHAIVAARNPDESQLVRRVLLDGIATHGHPRALLGGVIHALALRQALIQEGTLGYGALLEYLLNNLVLAGHQPALGHTARGLG